MSLITCIILGVLSLILFITGICFIIYEDIALSSYSIFLAIILAFGAAYCGHVYFKDQQFVFCPNCQYQYHSYEKFDYCPECNAKLRNKCDSCNKYLPDSATGTCPYCGESLKTKVGEIPESKKSSDEKQQYSKCPNCNKSLEEMKNIEQCPYCNFKLNQVVTSKANECPECHHDFEGMDYIKDICPFCGKKIN